MNPMDSQEQLLPEDLQEIERMLRAAPPPAPPALFERITASREIAVVVERMLLTDDPFAKRSQQYRTLISIAASALLMVGAFGVWRYVDSRTPSRANVSKTPRVAAANQVARLPRVSATTGANEPLSRLLIPWPATAGAQLPSTADRRFPQRAMLVAQTTNTLSEERFTLKRLVTDSKGNKISQSFVDWQIERHIAERNAPYWWSISRRMADSTGEATEVDSLLFAFYPELAQRRLHRGDYDRYFHFDPRHRTVFVADSALLLRYAYDSDYAHRERLWTEVPNTSTRRLNGRHTLVVSEAHLAMLLRGVALHVGWEATVAVPSALDYIAPRYDADVMGLKITGIDTIQARLGPVSTFRMELNYGNKQDIWWLDSKTNAFVASVRPLGNRLWEHTTVEALERPVRTRAGTSTRQ